MRNNFTSRVQKVIRYSKEEAMRLGHDYIGTEHLLLGIIKEGEGIAIKILKNLAVELDKLKQRLEEASGPAGGMMTLGNLPLSKRAEKVLKVTYLEAKNFKSDIIGWYHLFGPNFYRLPLYSKILGQPKLLGIKLNDHFFDYCQNGSIEKFEAFNYCVDVSNNLKTWYHLFGPNNYNLQSYWDVCKERKSHPK